MVQSELVEGSPVWRSHAAVRPRSPVPVRPLPLVPGARAVPATSRVRAREHRQTSSASAVELPAAELHAASDSRRQRPTPDSGRSYGESSRISAEGTPSLPTSPQRVCWGAAQRPRPSTCSSSRSLTTPPAACGIPASVRTAASRRPDPAPPATAGRPSLFTVRGHGAALSSGLVAWPRSGASAESRSGRPPPPGAGGPYPRSRRRSVSELERAVEAAR